MKVGGGAEGVVGIRLICCIPGQFQYLDNYGFFSGAAAAETSCLLIQKRVAEQRRWRWTPKVSNVTWFSGPVVGY